MSNPLTNKEYSEAYNYLYKYKKYRGNTSKNKKICLRVLNHNIETCGISKADRILIISCGKGFLLDEFLKNGYNVEATEISDYLLQTVLKDKPVRKLYCNELDRIKANKYRLVICRDVLEHLSSVEEVDFALAQLFRISSEYVFISMGGCAEKYNGLIKNGRDQNDSFDVKHYIKASCYWWDNKYSAYGKIIEHNYTNRKRKRGWYIFGEK